MNAIKHAWEYPLLTMAYQARTSSSSQAPCQDASSEQLEVAYSHCDAITAKHSRSFYLASRLLPKNKRRAVRALYAFCRRSDDLVDQPTSTVSSDLEQWRRLALMEKEECQDPVVVAWRDTSMRYRIPVGYASQLLDGVARDLTQVRYETFEDLTVYCYGVASTVGLMSMKIIGSQSDGAIPYAVKLGVALQLTNILRDMAEDWQRGRVYLPLNELEAFGLSEADIDAGIVDRRWQDFMRFQIARTRQLYEEALPGIAWLAKDGRLSTLAAAELYGGILSDIESNSYDVFNHRAHLNGWEKLRRVPGLWWRVRSMARGNQDTPRPVAGLVPIADIEN